VLENVDGFVQVELTGGIQDRQGFRAGDEDDQR
jgi:hypothetical protein